MSIEDWLGDAECSASSGWVGTVGLCGCSAVDFVAWISVNLSAIGWQDFLHATSKKKKNSIKQKVVVLYLQIFSAQNYVLFKILA